MKEKKRFICQQCGAVLPKWMGKCPECSSWNSIVEEMIVSPAGSTHRTYKQPVSLNDIVYSEEERILTSIGELDRVLGGGIVPGSLILVGGDPGIGKSTLMLQICGNLSKNRKVLYISGEESEKQIKLRADRLGIKNGTMYIMAENNMDEIEAVISEIKPDIAIIDSIQTVYFPQISSGPGSVSQIREATVKCLRLAKETGSAIFIVGHVTKEGSLAGPKLLEHMVDCVLYFEGERYYSYRLLRAVKNRFGSTNEIGIFEMRDKGLAEVDSPSKYLLSGKPNGTPGSAVVCILEGTRPLLVEVQALVSKSGFTLPRRQTSGIDYNRAVLLTAVLEKKLGFILAQQDIFVNVAGGIKINEPGADLAIVLAIASSFKNRPVAENTVIIGEVGLAGEVRAVNHMEKRIKEAAKLGFSRAIIPSENAAEISNIVEIKIDGVKNIREAVEAGLE
ncbi:DNA repair protein RadA [Tepidanaerobacter syntrophicus]|uniref:DNA repair protein RadA n=1 Tax=Tepidanaerobacter syntrophicus TaxID=224999 RepID=A0A0U9HFN6_9FIRM|nr:DNA repair protein RadA [Tepidanaerobacter syntrophicus]GAQ25566.1 DNA repair protein RadA/Sms [Tepidanaerobacter syntrophicus]GLI20310.1 DNA repair protein RadA [Tepidanaerobacter syntrophicus]